jgi:23S rRNA (cytosine1962-C5)-methyltransferase
LREELVELLVRGDEAEAHRDGPGTTSLASAYGVATLDAPAQGIITPMHDLAGYELLDLGGAARLERFGDRVIDRPAPGALEARRDPAAWASADLRFDRDRGWTGPGADEGPWTVATRGLTLELRPTEAGQVGLFPEHAAMLPWLRERGPVAVLNLFAYTGLVTLSHAAVGGSVTHVDSSRPAVAWARRNAELSGLADRPVRWIVDDARTFVGREARRGRRYGGIVLDPPTYGHGTAGGAWHLEDDLAGLLFASRAILEPDGFALLTAHTPGFDPDRLARALADGLGRPVRAVEAGELALETATGARLALGAFARLTGGA